MNELEILRRRRELVLLSAELQRATLVRRFDHLQQHPVQLALTFAASVASVPLLFKLGSIVAHKIVKKKRRMSTTQKRRVSVLALLPLLLRYLPLVKAVLPKLRSLYRTKLQPH